ncbi:MAG: DUF308 domain-containing protein [Oscillospiraceae bacterium]
MAKTSEKTKKYTLGDVKWSYVGMSLFLISLGLCTVIWPNIGLVAVCVSIGAGAVLFGVFRIIVYFLREVRGVALSYDFSVGLLALAVGVVLLIHPQGVLDFLQIVIGIYLLIDSVFKLQTALDSKRLGMSGWWVPLIFTVVCLGLGVLMILKVGADFIMALIGAALIADGLQNLCLVIYAAVAAKQLARMDKDGDGKPDIIDMTPEQSPDPAASSAAASTQISDFEGNDEP